VFTEVNDQWRSYRAQYHRIGDDPARAVTVYEEKDDIAFSVGVARSTDDSLIFISTGNNSSSELRFVPADDPVAPLTLIRPRVPEIQYDADIAHGKLWILTNDSHVNFRIATADPASPGEWCELVAGSERTYLRGITSHRDHLLVQARVDGLDQLLLRNYATGETERVPFAEQSYSASFTGNPEYAPESYRLAYSSMVTPATIYDYHAPEKRLEVRKIQEIPSGYDAGQYVTERVTVTARDGVTVPVSVLRRKDFAKDGSGKLFVYGYGAYGLAIPPSFSTSRLPYPRLASMGTTSSPA
jgi:oligopeptidase B